MLLRGPVEEEVIIVGAGPIGLASAISARRRGIDPLIVDAGAVVNSIVHYPVAMTFFTTPERLEIGGHPFPCARMKSTREETIKYYRGVARQEGLRIATHTRLLEAERVGDALECRLENRRGEVRARTRRLVLATGYFDQPNRLGVPGEELPHVRHTFDEAHHGYDLDVVVIGGKNSAVEAALELFRAGARTTLVYRGAQFRPSVKYWMKPDIENRIRAGEIAARFSTEVVSIDLDSVVVQTQGGQPETLPADRVYALIGYRPDQDLFRRIGIRLAEEDGRPDLNPETFETNVPGVFMAGSITAGSHVSEIFIENGRFDGEKIFGTGG